MFLLAWSDFPHFSSLELTFMLCLPSHSIGGTAAEDPFKYSRSIKLWGGGQSTVVAPRAPANSVVLPEDLAKGIDDLDESSDEDSGEAHRKEDEKSAELQRWQIKEEDLKIDYNRCLGKGSFGAVYLYVLS